MNEELRERREQTYRQLVAYGRPHAEVVARLADEYDVTRDAIRKDIKQMPEWLGDLSVDFGAGIVRLTRLRDQQQELEMLALQAQQDGDLNAAIRARREIRNAILAEEQIADRMGLAPEGEATDEEEPWGEPIEMGLSETNEALVNEWAGLPTEPTYILEDGRLVRVDDDGNVFDEEDELVGETDDEDLLPGDEHRRQYRNGE